MQLDWWTLALQAINFLILVWLLSRFLFVPVRKVIADRRARTLAAETAAEAKGSEADATRQELEAEIAKLAAEREATLQAARKDIGDERRQMVEAAQGEAARIAEAARATLSRERREAEIDLQKEAASLAVAMAGHLLELNGDVKAGEAALTTLLGRIEALPEDERERLQADLGGGGAGLTVVTAVPLDEQRRAAWQKSLGERVGAEDDICFVVEPALIGGAELRFPHAVLSASWADALRRGQAAMAGDDDAR